MNFERIFPAAVRAGAAVLAMAATTLAAQPAATPAARGLIVQLKAPVGGNTARSDSPQAQRDRLASVARSAGVAMQSARALNAGHMVLGFGGLLQGPALDDALRRMRLHPEVAGVEPDVRVRRLAVPDDPQFATQQWNLQAPLQYAAAIGMPQAWDISTGTPVTVAVLDTGIRPTHPELAGRVLPGYDFVSDVPTANDGDARDPDPSDPGDWVSASDTQSADFSGCVIEDSTWHGTFIAGQIGALTNNAQGIAAVHWNARILPVRVSGKCGAFVSDILDAIRWAAGLPVAGVPANPNPARVLNLSFGGDAPCSAASQAVIDEAAQAGALLVVAAGNESGALRRPADCSGVLTVAAVRSDGAKADYSNYGANVGIAAPGGSGLLSLYSLANAGRTVPTLDTYGFKSGTSFASPQAAALAALMLSVHPGLSGAQLATRIREGARPHRFAPQLPDCGPSSGLSCNCTAATCGAGLLDGAGALLAALRPSAVPQLGGTPVPQGTVNLVGTASTAATGASISRYQWSQVSGPAAQLTQADQATARLVVPAAGGTMVFQLEVTDQAGRVDRSGLTVTTDNGPAPPPSGGGGGHTGWLWGLGLWALLLAGWRRRA